MLKENRPANAHKTYAIIWLTLLVLLGASLAFGRIGNVHVMTALVFAIAAVKIGIVMRYFMHMKFEPWLLAALMVGAFLCLVALFIGVAPDLVMRDGWAGR